MIEVKITNLKMISYSGVDGPVTPGGTTLVRLCIIFFHFINDENYDDDVFGEMDHPNRCSIHSEYNLGHVQAVAVKMQNIEGQDRNITQAVAPPKTVLCQTSNRWAQALWRAHLSIPRKNSAIQYPLKGEC